MTRFIWVRDRDKIQHYINVNVIERVTKVPPSPGIPSGYSYMVLKSGKEINLTSNEKQDIYDTYEDVISKIQVAMA